MANYNQRDLGCKMEIARYPGESKKVSYSGSNNEFPYFALLPAEIRQPIWTVAIENDSKVIEMKHPACYRLLGQFEVSQEEHDNTRQLFKNNKSDHSGLLGACYESREIILPTLQELRICHGQKVLFNPLKDIIYFGPSSYIPHWDLIDKNLPARYIPREPSYSCWPSNLIVPKVKLSDDNIETGIHPLMCKRGLKGQRDKIVNIAIDLEFWRLSQQIDTTMNIINEFQSIQTVVLSAGDVGERMIGSDLGQEQFLSPRERGCIFKAETVMKISMRKMLAPRWGLHWGTVSFSNDADDTTEMNSSGGWTNCPYLEAEGYGANSKWDKLIKRLGTIEFSTKCARRRGIYSGHPNRTKTGAIRAEKLQARLEQKNQRSGSSLLTRY